MVDQNHLANCFASLAARLRPHEFANVIAAWRGPDDGDELLKGRTTGVIRRVVLDEIPGWEKASTTGVGDRSFFQGFLVAKIAETIRFPSNYFESENFHFFSHIRSAAQALGIKVIYKDD